MAIVRIGPIAQQVVGSIGAATFKQTRHGQVLAKRVTKTRKTSPALLAQQARLAAIAHAWHTLTDNQRRSWASLAARLSHTNALGQRIRWTGFELFTHENVLPLLASQALTTTPPAIAHTAPVKIAVGLISTAIKTLGAQGFSWLGNARAWAFAQRCYAPRLKYPIYWTYVGFDTGATSVSINIKPLFDAKLGNPPAGEIIRLKCIYQVTDYLISAPTQTTATSAG